MTDDKQTTIETERLKLRPLRLADAPRLAQIANTAEIARQLATMPHPYGEKDALEFIARVRAAPSGAACFAIVLKGDGTVIGTCGYGPAGGRSDAAAPETDFGYWLGLDYWGKGYATEAGKAVLAHAFGKSRVDVLTTDYQLGNQPSANVLAKLGFRTIGARRRHSMGSGAEVETMQVELRREDWLAQHGAGQ